jgi:predicted DNA-binding transcriptional regulator AlpA
MQLIGYKGLFNFGIRFSRQHILRLQAVGKFPLRRKIGNVNFWTVDEIRNWIENLPKPPAPPK